MIICSILILVGFCSFPSLGWAEDAEPVAPVRKVAQSSDQEEAYSKPGVFLDRSWTLALGFSKSGASVTHATDLNGGSVASLGAETAVPEIGVRLKVMKEFFYNSRFSVSGLLNVGTIMGTERGSTGGVSFVERASGPTFGGGASVNWNFYGAGLGIQPFVAAEVAVVSTDRTLEYSSGGSSVSVVTQSSGLELVPSLGIRVLDPHAGMMSFISVGMVQSLSTEVSRVSTVDGTVDAGSTDLGEVKIDSLQIQVGFGFFF